MNTRIQQTAIHDRKHIEDISACASIHNVDVKHKCRPYFLSA